MGEPVQGRDPERSYSSDWHRVAFVVAVVVMVTASLHWAVRNNDKADACYTGCVHLAERYCTAHHDRDACVVDNVKLCVGGAE